MKKLFLITTICTLSFASAQTNAFKGSDFENFADFTKSLNNYGLKSYATQDAGNGVGDSAALKISTTTDRNDYVFTANGTETLPATIKDITFMVKGTADKSLSINLYKTDGSSYKFNIGDLKADATIEVADNNNYAGVINTNGKYVKVTLNCASLKDISRDSSSNFFAIKIGKEAPYNLDIDDIKVN
ncbi:hypothetical protein SAMN05421847_0018 [Halpernia humi]|uniref:Uncharacterized protein n=1 Tax=Halpernia humi TaxID=493375 RepID=A0A1H5S1D4_9FLAO|nr:hypothetical protein [Halpernia humi]SEF44422.1 hypothetical protein SAMN05421847_0018 [Halpernia humi]